MKTIRSELAYHTVSGTIRAVLRGVLRWRWRTTGTDRVPAGPAVLAFNHISYTDAFVVGLPLVSAGRRPRFLVKREILGWPVVGWLARNARMIPVGRSDADDRAGALAAAVDFLRQGELVLVAPEQTISRSFDLLPLRTGAVRIAQQAGVPVVPSANWGSQRFLTKGARRRWAFRLPVEVAYGEPIHIGPEEDPVEATARLETAMQALLDEVIARYPDTAGAAGAWWHPARLGGGAPDHAEVSARHTDRTDLA